MFSMFKIVLVVTSCACASGTSSELYPYGNGTSDTEASPTGVYTWNVGFHYIWNIKQPVYSVYTQGYMIIGSARISFWDNTEMLFTDKTGSNVYMRRSTSGPDIDHAQDDIRSVFSDTYPYNTFVPSTVAVLTSSKFTYSTGSSLTPVNTVQVVIIYNSELTFVMINIGDTGWWSDPNGTYPTIGVSYRPGSGNDYNYLITGSGTPDIEHMAVVGNSGIPRRWVFAVSTCRSGQCIILPHSYISVGTPDNYTSACLDHYTGAMCQYEIQSTEIQLTTVPDTQEPSVTQPIMTDRWGTPGLHKRQSCQNGHYMNETTRNTCLCNDGYTGLVCDVNIKELINDICSGTEIICMCQYSHFMFVIILAMFFDIFV